uniref:Uncharacterized protein n=1 Tax=Rhipicephalus zambeziensis TaxID=60191 RepID=A0A224YAJ8_9ACAR
MRKPGQEADVRRGRRGQRRDRRQELGQSGRARSARRRTPGKRRLLAVVVVVVMVGRCEHGVRQALAAAHGSRAVGQAAQRAADQADRLVAHGAQPRTQRCRRNHAAAVRRHDGGPSEGQGPTPGRHALLAVHAREVVEGELFTRNASSVSCRGNGSCSSSGLHRYCTEVHARASIETLTGTLVQGEAPFFRRYIRKSLVLRRVWMLPKVVTR